jgi:hypothetical protein
MAPDEALTAALKNHKCIATAVSPTRTMESVPGGGAGIAIEGLEDKTCQTNCALGYAAIPYAHNSSQSANNMHLVITRIS